MGCLSEGKYCQVAVVVVPVPVLVPVFVPVFVPVPAPDSAGRHSEVPNQNSQLYP